MEILLVILLIVCTTAWLANLAEHPPGADCRPLRGAYSGRPICEGGFGGPSIKTPFLITMASALAIALVVAMIILMKQ